MAEPKPDEEAARRFAIPETPITYENEVDCLLISLRDALGKVEPPGEITRLAINMINRLRSEWDDNN